MKVTELQIGDYKEIPGFEGLYGATRDGLIISCEKEICIHGGRRWVQKAHIIKQYKNKDGYLQVKLSQNGKVCTRSVHRLIALAFLDNPNGYSEINHKDENKENNNVSNLEWCTKSYNNSYGTRTSRTSRKVKSIDKNGNEVIYNSIRSASRICGIPPCNIRNCANHKIIKDGKGNDYTPRTAGGYKWEWFV